MIEVDEDDGGQGASDDPLDIVGVMDDGKPFLPSSHKLVSKKSRRSASPTQKEPTKEHVNPMIHYNMSTTHSPTTPNPNATLRPASMSIVNGSNSLFALFDEETQKIKLEHRARLVELESHFQQYRVSVSEQNAKANIRIKELEEEVARLVRTKELEKEVVRLKEELLVARGQSACQPSSESLCVDDCAGELDLFGLEMNSNIPDPFLPEVDPWVDCFQVLNSRPTTQSPGPAAGGPANEHVDFFVDPAHVTPELVPQIPF